MADDEAPLDVRVEKICDRVVPLLKSKPEFFRKLYQTEEGETIIKSFVNDEGSTRMFFLAGPKDIQVSTKPPDEKQTKKKSVFCIKTAEVKFDEKKLDEMFDKCIVGDLSPSLLQNMHGLLKNVYLPLVSNPRNMEVGNRLRSLSPLAKWAACPSASRTPRRSVAAWLAGLARGSDEGLHRQVSPHARRGRGRHRSDSGKDAARAAARRDACPVGKGGQERPRR